MTDFLDDERRRLAYADRAPTREQQADSRGYHSHDPSRHCRDRNCDYEVGGRWSCEYPPICTPQLADGTGRHSRKEMEQATQGYSVSFTSVPQLCAAYEYALSTLKALYLLVDLKQHAWQPEQEVMREARRLLLAAGKDVE